MKSWHRLIPVYVSFFAMSALPPAVAAAFDGDTKEAPLQLEEIVVTATKSGQVSAQKLPQSISVLSREEINQAGVHTLEDVSRLTPGLNLTRNGPWTRLYMRGIGTNLDFIGSDPSVTVHVDGVYQSRTAMVLDELLDVERIEVLRGPQGTLYGRNSTGGTINIITRLPDATPRSTVSAELGSYSLYRVMASASGGLGSDNVIGSMSVVHTEHDPYIKNVNSAGVDGLLDNDLTKTNGSLQFALGDMTKLILRGDYSANDNSSAAYKTTGRTTTGSPAPLAGLLDTPDDPFKINENLDDTFTNQEAWGTSAELVIDINENWSLTSLTAYRSLDNDGREDTDGSNINQFITTVQEQQSQTSEELRLNYLTDQISWVAGVYLFQENHDHYSVLDIVPFASSVVIDDSHDVNAYALFTQGTFEVAPALNLTLGVRYSNEKKEFSRHQTSAYDDSKSWDDVSPLAALNYDLNEHAMVYVSASKGFKSGGYNFSSATAEAAQYDPEEVLAYEAGAKLLWAQDRVRTNIAIFQYDYKDLQVSDFAQVGNPSISNAASATIQGLEIENQWLASDALTLIFNLAVLDATYDEYMANVSAGNYVDVSGNKLNAAPDNEYTLGAQYWIETGWGDCLLRVDYAWQDKQYFTAFNEDVSSQGAYGLLSANATFASPDGHVEIQIYGNNLTNEDYATSSREFPAPVTGVTRDMNPPRTLGTRLTYNF